MSVKNILFLCLLAMTPVVELRGAVPVGVSMGMPLLPLLLLCVVCNLIPAPFIMLFIRRLLDWMDTRGGFLHRVSRWVHDHAQRKIALYYKYQLIGLYLLVALPVPGTGAWTGSLIAALMNVRMKNALPVIFLGLCTSAFLMTCITYGVSALF